MSQAAVNDYDRFTFAIFMAGLVHALLIFGVSFTLPEKQNSATTLDVTLAQHVSDKAPEDADFLAQANQIGSGTLEERADMTTTELAEYAAELIQETQPDAQSASAPTPHEQSYQALVSLDSDRAIQTKSLEQQLAELDLPKGPQKSLLERSLEIASLEARLDQQRQTLSKRPRVRRLTATSARSSNDALYMNRWRERIETLGKKIYSMKTENNLIGGELRLLVAIKSNGTIHQISLLESSGEKEIDDAAIQIVRQAAPFQPFTEAMRKETDILEIIRTWNFTPPMVKK